MRRSWLLVAVGCAVQGCSGGDQNPCSNCPAIAGTYTVTFNGSGNSTPGCVTLGIGSPQGPLFINQQGASLAGSAYSGFGLTGTLFDTNNFSLSGFGPDAGSLFIQARFAPGAADGGTIQNGLITTQYSGTQATGAVACSQSFPFTAQ